MHVRWAAIPFLAALGAAGLTSQAQIRKAEHPFLYWTREDAAAIRSRIETDPAAKRQWAMMSERESKGGREGGHPAFLNLFKYAVLGDEAAGAAERAALLRFIGARPPESTPGNPASGNAPYRDDRTLDALRYDVLYVCSSPWARTRTGRARSPGAASPSRSATAPTSAPRPTRSSSRGP